MKSKQLPPDLASLMDQLMRAMHRYDGGRTLPIMQEAKLTTGQLAVLELARTPRTVSAVASSLGLSRPATSQMIDRLVRGGWLERTENRRDRRERPVSLSAAGNALWRKIAEARIARFERSLAVLPKALASQLSSVLSAVVAILNQEGNES